LDDTLLQIGHGRESATLTLHPAQFIEKLPYQFVQRRTR
jgi:hypothetical protein